MRFRNLISIVSVCFLLMYSNGVFAGPVPDTGDPNERTCNPRSYNDLGNGIIRDNVTGLMWQQATAPDKYSWQEAISYCSNLSLGGYTDWRLPTVKELSSLVDYSRSIPCINMSYFPDTAAAGYSYWSSTQLAAPGFARCVDFTTGGVRFSGKSGSLHARAVRGESSNNNFIDNKDGTITDSSTGLMWEKSTVEDISTWEQAKAYCGNLTLGGQSDWRLPTIIELLSIVNYNATYPTTFTAFFPDKMRGVQNKYWSSTTLAFNTDFVLVMDFFSGGTSTVDRAGKLYYVYLRAVRAGKCGSFGSSTTTTVSGDTTTTISSGPCPAQKVLGKNNPDLEKLRAFRNNTLMQSAVGRKIIGIYYNNAESINKALEQRPALKAFTKTSLETAANLIE